MLPVRTSSVSSAPYGGLVSLEDIESVTVRQEGEIGVDRSTALERLLRLIQHLKPVDRQVIVSYLLRLA